MTNSIFRKKSLDKISSPDQLDNYIRVSNPGVWVLLVFIVILLLGFCVWGIFGHIDTKIESSIIVKNGKAVCYLTEEQSEKVKEGMPVIVENEEYGIDNVSMPKQIKNTDNEYYVHILGLSTGDWVRAISFETELKDGIYTADVVVERTPLSSFVFN